MVMTMVMRIISVIIVTMVMMMISMMMRATMMTICVQRNQLHICGTHGKIQIGAEGSFQGIPYNFV